MAAIKYKRVFILFLAVCPFVFFNNTLAQSYGLIVSSHEVVAENRTSLELTDGGPICYTKTLDFSFDFSFVPNYTTYFGYIFRLINDKNQNIDLIYNQKQASFQIIYGETFTGIDFQINNNVLQNDWIQLKFTIDAAKNITCYYGNKKLQSKQLDLKSNCFKLIFGVVNEHDFVSRDTPPMKLKNVAVKIDGTLNNFWPLNESSGSIATDTIKQKIAKVVNPIWIGPKHSNWDLIKSFSVKGSPSVAFDAEKEELFVVSRDSLLTLSAQNFEVKAQPLSTPLTNLLPGNQSIFDNRHKKLYNFYIDQKKVSEYNFKLNRWNNDLESAFLTEYWQANKFSNTSNLFIIGGYGQLKYKNSVHKYNLLSGSWDTLQPGGDFLAPRYLSALGTTKTGDTAYIIGGYGSREGDQVLSPKYFYDLLIYDVQKNAFKKLFDLPKPDEDFVFANSLVIDSASNSYYALIFPNYQFKSQLQLIKGSLNKNTYTLMGNPFPYSFLDIKSFADLFYCSKSHRLLAATLYTAPEDITEVKIYSIYFPPNELTFNNPGIAKNQNTPFRTTKFFYALIAFIIIVVTSFIVGYLKRKNRSKRLPVEFDKGRATLSHIPGSGQISPTVMKPEASRLSEEDLLNRSETLRAEEPGAGKSKILLFGTFDVITVDGINITKQFTPLLKEMFLLILIDSLRYNKGVSSEKLNEVLWNDKDLKDAKNNRSVNLVKLKNILDKLGGSTINRETGSWKLEYNHDLIYIDFLEYLSAFSETPIDAPSPTAVNKLLAIVQKGSFLQQVHYQWLDTIKAEISNFVIEYLIKYTESVHHANEPEKLISIANAIFTFDELNEFALKLKCKTLIGLGRHTLAKTTFDKFGVKYKEIYGEEFNQSYNSLVEHHL